MYNSRSAAIIPYYDKSSKRIVPQPFVYPKRHLCYLIAAHIYVVYYIVLASFVAAVSSAMPVRPDLHLNLTGTIVSIFLLSSPIVFIANK